MMNKKYSFNENYFEIIDTLEKAYWLGFLAADGCIHPLKPVFNRKLRFLIKFSLSQKDGDMVIAFNKALNSTYPIKSRYRTLNGKIFTSHVALFYSKKMFSDLISHGVTPKKSLTLEPPKNIPIKYISHWVRGYFDGDGYVGSPRKGRLKTSVASTEKVLKFIQNKLNGVGQVTPHKISPIFYLHINKQEDIKKFYKYLYKEAAIFLKRKKLIFDRVYYG